MTHPISPLARSQTNLELMEGNNARQALLPSSSDMHRDESSYSLAVPQMLQVSRRPSVLLQEILGGRKDHGGGGGGGFARKKSAHAGLVMHKFYKLNIFPIQMIKINPIYLFSYFSTLNGTVTGSTITIQGDSGAKSFQAKQSKEKNRRQGK